MKIPCFVLWPLFLCLMFFSSGIKSDDNVTIAASENVNGNLRDPKKSEIVLSEKEIVLEKWRYMERKIQQFSRSAVKMILPHILRSSERINISSQCTKSIMQMISGVKQMKTWAYKMIDSSGKFPNGILNGYLVSLGDYDGCLEVEVPGPNSFRGQYCTIFLKPPLPKWTPFHNVEKTLPEFINFTKKGLVMEEVSKLGHFFRQVVFRTSVCVPSTCSRNEMQAIANSMTAGSEFSWNATITTCDVIEPTRFSKGDLAVISVLSVIGFLAFIATTTDVILNAISKETRSRVEASSIAVKCLMCFSTYTNTLRLLKNDTSRESIKIFHGMKVVTILWVMLNHAYYYTNFNLCAGMMEARRFGHKIAFQLIANGFLNVETFFFISAVLLAYSRMKFTGKTISVPLYIFRRLWRLAPPLMLVIATSTLIPHMGSGPGWKETVGSLIDKCKANWWTNLLFFNNFISSEDMCFDWLWYIPVDTHLYILALFVMVPLKSLPKVALGMNAMIFIIGTAISASSHIYYQHQPTAIYVFSDKMDIRYYTDNSYFRSYTHVTTCCIGLYTGYILAVRPKLKIPKVLNIFGWLTSVLLALVVLYGVYDWNQGNVPSLAVSTLYMCTNKVVWALALGYVTIACCTGNGGVVTSVLSWKAFVPLSRLTYAAYLVHPIFLFMYVGSTRVPLSLDHKTIVYRFLGNIIMSYIAAYVVSLLFESPFMCLEKIMLSRGVTPKAALQSNPESENKSAKESSNVQIVISDISISKRDNEQP